MSRRKRTTASSKWVSPFCSVRRPQAIYICQHAKGRLLVQVVRGGLDAGRWRFAMVEVPLVSAHLLRMVVA